MRTLRSRLALCAALAGLLAGSAACSSPAQDTVTIMVPWSGTEFDAFYSLVQQFQKQHPSIKIEYLATRAQSEQLDAAVQAGHPPDLAVVPSIGTVGEYIHPANGRTGLARLGGDGNIDPSAFVEPFRGLMTLDGGVYVVPIKADVKSLIWYDSARSAAPPTTPDALRALSAERSDVWCLGLDSGATSGWPGADAIADLVLEKDGADAYAGWLSGTTSWSSSQVRDAWSTWYGFIRKSDGDQPTKALTTPFGDADFASPSAGVPLQVSADFLGMFATDNPGAKLLLDYLAEKSTQQAWVNYPGADAFSAESAVAPSAYPTPVQQRIAALLQPNAGRTLCFSIADAMQPNLAAAFYQAVTGYVAEPSALSLTTLLGELDKVRKNLTTSAVTAAVANRLCSS